MSSTPISPEVRFTCDACGAVIRVPAKYAGKTGKCKKCGSPVDIPVLLEETQPYDVPSDSDSDQSGASLLDQNEANDGASSTPGSRQKQVQSTEAGSTDSGFLKWLLVGAGGLLLAAVVIMLTVHFVRSSRESRAQAELQTSIQPLLEKSARSRAEFDFAAARQYVTQARDRLSTATAARTSDMAGRISNETRLITSEEQDYRTKVAQGWTVFEGQLLSPQQKASLLAERKEQERRAAEEAKRAAADTAKAQALSRFGTFDIPGTRAYEGNVGGPGTVQFGGRTIQQMNNRYHLTQAAFDAIYGKDTPQQRMFRMSSFGEGYTPTTCASYLKLVGDKMSLFSPSASGKKAAESGEEFAARVRKGRAEAQVWLSQLRTQPLWIVWDNLKYFNEIPTSKDADAGEHLLRVSYNPDSATLLVRMGDLAELGQHEIQVSVNGSNVTQLALPIKPEIISPDRERFVGSLLVAKFTVEDISVATGGRGLRLLHKLQLRSVCLLDKKRTKDDLYQQMSNGSTAWQLQHECGLLGSWVIDSQPSGSASTAHTSSRVPGASNESQALVTEGLQLAKAGGEDNYKKAMTQFQRAAEMGDADGIHNIGSMYNEGLGVPADKARAASQFIQAAEKGRIDDMFLAGLAYLRGEGVAKDYERARIWFAKVADAGDPRGMVLLAGMYLEGNGVDKDVETAKEWLRKADAKGDKEAADLLRQIGAGGNQ